MKHVALCLLLLVVAGCSYAGKIQFSGSVIEIASDARSQCLDAAIQSGIGMVCGSSNGAEILSSVRDISVLFKNEISSARIIMLNYR